jgi:hypothetical protein
MSPGMPIMTLIQNVLRPTTTLIVLLWLNTPHVRLGKYCWNDTRVARTHPSLIMTTSRLQAVFL